MESTPGTPSVIAKLMGLDESPPQQPVQKQRRVLSENYLRRVASIGVRQKCHSFRLIEDHKEFKDVFEVVDTLKGDKHHNLSVEKGNTDSDHFPKGNSLLNKHLNNLQVSPSNSQFGNTKVLNSTCSGNVDVCRESGSKHEHPNVTLLQKLENGIVIQSLGEVGLYNLHKFSRSQLESSKEECLPSTRIVVLKPKHGKAENSARCFPSLSTLEVSHSGDRKSTEFPNPGNGKIHVEVKERKNLACDMESMNIRSTVSRQIMGKLTRKTRCNKTNISTKVSRLASGGGNSFAVESELMRPPFLTFSDWKNQYQSFPFSDESYAAKEVRKQLSERWKMTKKIEEVGMTGRGNTVGDLLAMPACGTGPRKLDDMLVRHFRPKRNLVRYDLKDLDLSKFKREQDKYEALCNEWSSRPKRSIKSALCRSWEYKINQNDGSRPIKLRFNTKKLQYFPGLGLEGNYTVEKTHVVHDDLKNKTEKRQQSGPRACIFLEKDDDSSSHDTDSSVQQETPVKLYEESYFLLHCSITQPDCMVGLEEAYQPSPVSVLEPPFRGESSPTTECSGRINVDITEYSDTCSEGSGMIVSSDDDTNEGSVSDYKKNDLMRLFRVEESRDFSYIVGVLSEAGFCGRTMEMDLGSWCSPELPISLAVFDTLEKKFGDQMPWKRSDRRVLFDRINAGLVEILQPRMGVPTWTKPVSRRIRSNPSQEMIEEDLWMLLVSQEKEGRTDLEENIIGREIGKLDLRDDIDGIGREIERFLVDELVAEFVSMENF